MIHAAVERDARGGARAGPRALGALLATALVAFGIERAHGAPRPPSGSHAAVSLAPPSSLDLEHAYAVAEELVGARRHMESLPYFRRMLEQLPLEWSLRHDYANALQGASMEGRSNLGLPLRAARSSFESIELMRAALHELDRAQRLAPTPRATATVHLARARQLGAWGLPWDALAEARAAAAADASWPRAALAARQWTRRLTGPDFHIAPDSDSGEASALRARAAAPRPNGHR